MEHLAFSLSVAGLNNEKVDINRTVNMEVQKTTLET
jgi:hypothetical protein